MSETSDYMSLLSPEKRELLELLLEEQEAQLDPLPLSFAQQRMWFLNQFEPDSSLYNIPAAIRLTGELHRAALEYSLNQITQRHEILQTTFRMVNNQPVQIISDWQPVNLPLLDLRELPDGERAAAVERLTTKEAQRPFDLQQGPLLRTCLIQTTAQEHILLLTLHHIVADGWSITIFVQELAAFYRAFVNNRDAALPELPIQYADYAVWQREHLRQDEPDNLLDKQLAYWRHRLDPAGTRELPVLNLPTDRPRPSKQTFRGTRYRLTISQSLTAGIKDLSRRENVTPFMVLVAAFNVLLFRYTGQRDLLIGTPTASRTQDEVEGLIGCFVNTLILRTRVAGNPAFRDLLQQVRTTTLAAYDHQDLPFEILVEALRIERDMSRAPIAQVQFAFQNRPLPALELPGLSLELLDVETGTAKFDLSFSLEDAADGLRGDIEYNTDLFDRPTIARMSEHFRMVLEAIVAHPNARIADLPLLTLAEQQQFTEWNSTQIATPYTCLHHLIEVQAARAPDAIAVSYAGRALSYADLNRQANQIAHYLQKLGVAPEMRVGVCLDRSPALIVALVGILKAGGAYVPLDPAYPQERLAFLIRDAQISILLTERRLAEVLPAHGALIVCLDQDWPQIDACPTTTPDSRVTPDHLAYVIYTSGSTGQPKGVAVTHRSVANLIAWHCTTFALTSSDRTTQIAGMAFDAMAWEVWPALAAGASLYIPDDETRATPALLQEWLRQQRITISFVPTPVTERLLGLAWHAPIALRMLLTGGDRLHTAPSETLPFTLVNNYGPTESTVVATSGSVPPGSSDTPPSIGGPIANTQIHLLDPSLHPVPLGVPGEVYIGGEQLARGYLNRPDLTAERFMPDVFSQRPGSRLYKTGDLARYRPDGTLEFVGRIDQQVKVRGFRIELGEIEATLVQHPQVREAVVLVREAAVGDRRLVAYVVGNKEQSELDAQALRHFLLQCLPDYMVPSAFVMLDELLLTPNGKVDRRALLAIDLPQIDTEYSFVPARTPSEELIAGLWSELLHLERVGVQDNFFELGGHSLLATQVIARLRQVFAVELPLRALFEAPTVAGLSRRIEQAQQAEAVPPIVPVSRAGDLPLSFAQERLWFLNQLDPGSATFNLTYYVQLRGSLDVSALEQSFNALIQRHAVLRTTFPSVAGQPVQRILPEVSLHLWTIDLRQHASAQRQCEVRRLVESESRQPFNLLDDSLLRAKLVQLADDEHLLLLTMHHIVADAWSQGVFTQELGALYASFREDQQPQIAELPIQYADYAVWQRQWLSGEVLEQQVAYWRQQLQPDGVRLPVLDLPTDRPRPAIQTFNGATVAVDLPAELTAALKSLSRHEGVTLFMTLLAAFQALLYRYTGQRDFGVGSPIANRTRQDLEGLIGFFINMLVLRARITEGSSFRDLLGTVRETALQAYAHQDLPFEKLVEELHLERDLSRSPLFEVMFVLQNAPAPALELPGIEVSPIEVPNQTAKYDLTLTLAESADHVTGTFEYNTDLFEAATITHMAGHFQTLLAAIVIDPGQQVAVLPLLSADEQQQMLYDWNATATSYPTNTCIHQAFEAQVEQTPDAVAVVFKDRQLSYRELNAQANQLAHHLRSLGVAQRAPGDSLVGIYMERSLEMVVGMLAALKAGAAYLPLDPAYPQERLGFMIEDARMAVMLTQQRYSGQLPPHQAQVVVVDAGWPLIAQLSDQNLDTTVTSDNLAYVIYTSGSTGQPKGVMVAHRNVLNFFVAMDQRIGSDPGVWLAVTSISFDISVLELLWTLTRGFQVVLQDEQPRMQHAAMPYSEYASKPIDFSLFYFASDEHQGGSNKYRLLLEGAKFADQHGFTAVWTPERHFHTFGGLYPNPSVVGAAIAAVTERVQIRAGSVVLPLQNPIRVAEEWSVVDNISQGRVGISFASGWHADDFVLAPEKYASRKEIMFRDIETVRSLWRGAALTFPNGGGSDTPITIHPQPIQSELPFWVTAAGTVETFEMAGKIGANLLTHLLSQSVEELKEKIAIYRRAWREHGHPGAGHVTLMVHTFVGDDLDVVREQVRKPFYSYLRSSLDLMKNLARTLGRTAETLDAHEEEQLLAHAFERYFHTSSLLGTPATCLNMINRLKAIDVDEVGCLIDFGVDVEAVLSSLHNLNTVKELSNQPATPGDEADYSLAAQIVRHGVSHFQCTPSMARMLTMDLEGIGALGSLRKLMLGGEALPPALAQQLSALSVGEIHNMYGPTETTIWSATHRVGAVDQSVPIGRPVANTAIHILDRYLQPTPPGVPGELYIGGDGVVRGYLHRPELTAERFVPNPFAGCPGGRLYKTGDLARYQPDGTIEFLGRLDHQVKLQGHRIELGEIEAALSRHPAIDEVVVVVRADETEAGKHAEQRLVAYVVPPQQGLKPLRPKLSPQAEAELFAGQQRYTLPNGMVIAHLNDHQANAGYREVIENAAYLRHGITLDDGACVFDVGANIGFFSLYVNQVCQNAEIYAFEPIPPTFNALRTNMTLYGLNVHPRPLGLSRTSETVEFTFYPEQSGLSGRYADLLQDRQATKAIMLSGLQHNGQSNIAQLEREIDELLDKQFRSESFLCQVRTLSEVLREERIERIDLLKIDVERSEYDVLCGVEDQDWPKIRQIVMEVDTPENLASSTALLEQHGYSVVVEDLVVAEHPNMPPVHVYMLYASRAPLHKAEINSGALVDQWMASATKSQVSVSEMREFLKDRLPEYMIPSTFVTLPALPLTPNGKIDRKALPAPGMMRPDLDVSFEAPKTEIEQSLAAIWQSILRVEQVGLHDNFFELGGTSLLIVQARTQIREALGYDVSLVDLFRYPTIAALARHLNQPKAATSTLDKTRQEVEKQKQVRQQRRAALEGKKR